MTKKTKKLSAQTTVTTVASAQKFPMTDSNGNVTLISLADLKKEMLAGMNLNAMEDGVFIMFHRKSDNFPIMVKPHKWTSYQSSGEIADGVVIVEGGKCLVVAPTESDSRLLWSSAAVSGGGTTTSDRVTAINDWNGKTNTSNQCGHAECSGTNYAPGYCHAYSRVNANGSGLTAGKWWLPSMGEMMMIYANMVKVNYALSLINGATQIVEDAYWTSTEYSATTAWLLNLGTGCVYGGTKASGSYRVRAVSAFIS